MRALPPRHRPRRSMNQNPKAPTPQTPKPRPESQGGRGVAGHARSMCATRHGLDRGVYETDNLQEQLHGR